MVEFKDNSGNITKGTDTVFPLIIEKDEHFEFWATGFFIQTGGGFITAKHNLYDKKDLVLDNIRAIEYRGDTHHIRKIEHAFVPQNSDVIVGMLTGDICNPELLLRNQVLALDSRPPEVGDKIHTYAYPQNVVEKNEQGIYMGKFTPKVEFGEIVEFFPEGRDATFLPGPCYQTNMLIEGGASGGPVFNSERGFVIGINSTGYDIEGAPISFITPISEIFNIEIHFADNMTIKEMGKEGIVVIK